MNMETSNVIAPPAPRSLDGMQLPIVMMRDILLKTIFRMNLNTCSELSEAICLPIPVTQEIIDLGRDQKLLQATSFLERWVTLFCPMNCSTIWGLRSRPVARS